MYVQKRKILHKDRDTQGEDERGRHGSDAAASRAKEHPGSTVTTRRKEEAREDYPESQSTHDPTETYVDC